MYMYWTAYIHVRVLDCLHTCTCTGLPTYMYMYWTAYIHVRVLDCLHTCTCTGLPTYMYMYWTAYIHVRVLDCLHTCTCTGLPAYMYMYWTAYIHVHLLYRIIWPVTLSCHVTTPTVSLDSLPLALQRQTFTPPHGTSTNLRVTNAMTAQEVIGMLLQKYNVSLGTWWGVVISMCVVC